MRRGLSLLLLGWFLAPVLAFAQGETPVRIKDGVAGQGEADVSSGRLLVDPSGVTSPISAASLPLPTGAATEATLGTLLLDSTLTGRFPAGGTPADNESNAVSLSIIRSYLYCFDGSTWDRCPGSSADGLLVNLGTNNDVTVTSGTITLSNPDDGILRDGSGDTIQANVSGGRLHVDGSGVTQPVSGTVTVTDGAGSLNVICDSGCSGGTQYDQGTATTDTDALTMAGAVRRDTAAVATGVADGDRLALSTDSVGRLRVTAADTTQPVSIAGTVATDPTDDDARVLGRTKIHDGTDTALVSGTGSLQVTCDNCGGASPFADDDAFTGGTTAIAITGGVFDDGLADVTSGSAAAPRITKDRALHANLRNNDGAEVGTAGAPLRVDPTGTTTQPVSGTVSVSNYDGITRDGSGDTTQANVSGGRLHVDGSGVTQPVSGTVTVTDGAGNLTVDGTVTANQGGAPWSVAGPAADGAAVSGNPVRIAGKDGSGNTQDIATDTSGELQIDVLSLPANASTNVAQFGGTNVSTGTGAGGAGIPRVTVSNDSAVRVRDNAGNEIASATTQPLTADRGLTVRQPISCPDKIAISQTADTQLITGSSGQRVHFCYILIFANAAETINLIEGTGSTCATSPTAIIGSTTEGNGVALTAGGGFTAGSGQPFMQTGVDANNVCLTQVGGSRVTGVISYRVAPND